MTMTIPDLFRSGTKMVMLVLLLSGLAGSVAAQESPLKPGDRINLKLTGVPEKEVMLVSGIYTVGGDETLNLPHLPEPRVTAGGVTRTALERPIQKVYRDADIYTKPTVVINIDDANPTARVVTVIGEVRSSGQVAFREKMTMLEAIAGSGGRSDFADMKRVLLMRDERTTEHDLRKVSADPSVDVTLRPGDKIIVRERRPFPGFGD